MSRKAVESRCIPKRWRTLQDVLASVRLPITQLKSASQSANSQKDHDLRAHRNTKSRDVRRRVLTAKNSTTNNTAKGSHTNERSAAECAFPLPSDVVRLVRQHARDIGIASSGGQENAEVPSAGVAVGPAHDGQTDDAQHGVEGDTDPPLMVFVAEPSSRDHHDASKYIRGCNEALSGAGIKLQLLVENDWEEVGERVGHGRRASEG